MNKAVSHIALYRKYRSQTFSDLVGQSHVVQTLQSAISAGRIAHAYLFTGPRGTGKTSTARIFAKSLNCEKGPTPEPCNECGLCKVITAGQGGDVIEMDAAGTSGVDNVREDIIENSKYAPMEGRYKIYIIDEVHDLSNKAFDALLKTIEEPPAHVVFIMATTEYNKVPSTIRSRCLRFEFHRGTLSDLYKRLEYVCEQEGINIEPAAISLIARFSDGGYRDALTLLEQAMLLSGEQITVQDIIQQLGLLDVETVDEMLLAASSNDIPTLLNHAENAIRLGKEPKEILESLLYRLSELTYSAFEVKSLYDADAQKNAANFALASKIGRETILRYRSLIADMHREMREITLPRLWLEIALLRLAEVKEVKPVSTKETTPALQSPVFVAKEIQTKKADINSDKKSGIQNTPPKLTINPNNIDEVKKLWAHTVAYLKQKYSAAGALMDSTRVADSHDKKIVIGFKNKFQLDRVKTKENIQKAIYEVLHSIVEDKSWSLEYVLDNVDTSIPEQNAVESPLEGEALVQVADEIFQTELETTT